MRVLVLQFKSRIQDLVNECPIPEIPQKIRNVGGVCLFVYVLVCLCGVCVSMCMCLCLCVTVRV